MTTFSTCPTPKGQEDQPGETEMNPAGLTNRADLVANPMQQKRFLHVLDPALSSHTIIFTQDQATCKLFPIEPD